jgi:hypothetical protein
LAAAGWPVLTAFRRSQQGSRETLAVIQRGSGTGELCLFDVVNATVCV